MVNFNPLILVNRENPLDPSYIPPNLVFCRIPWDEEFPIPSSKQCMILEASNMLELLCATARRYSIDITGVSAYRSYQRQKDLYDRSASKTFIAPPGCSEHQTGLAIDLSSPEIHNQLNNEFQHTAAYRFLLRRGPLYGFILRFPRGKEALTGYPFESWHFRYVGKENAIAIADRGICLEELVSSCQNT